MKIFLMIIGLFAATRAMTQTTTSDVWINEFHYDGITQYGQSDMNEFVEVAIKSSIANNATELAKYQVILYTSGAYDPAAWTLGKGLPYNVSSVWYSQAETVHNLNTFTACPVAGTTYTLLSKQLPILQDVPAAFALVYENTVIQLLSYEKQFKIAPSSQGGGAAAAMSTEVMRNLLGDTVQENATTTTNHSISLVGTGTSYSNFNWDDGPLVTATPCARNSNGLSTQEFSSPLPVRWLSFVAKASGQSILANWKVGTETGVLKYVVEIAGMNNIFSEAARLTYNRNANGSYHSAIHNLSEGTYRLRIRTDMMTGDVEYSEVRVVKLTNGRSQFVSVFPNPVKSGIANLTIIPELKTTYTIELIDMNGKRISHSKTPMLLPNTLNRIEIPVNTAPGIYQLKIISEHQQQTIKLVVM